MATQEQLLDRLDASERRAIRLRDKAKGAVEEAVNTVATVTGGAAAGFMDARWFDKRPLGLGLPLLTGGALTVVGLMGWAGKQSSLVGALGSGMLTAEAYKAVYSRSREGGATSGLGSGHVGQQFSQPAAGAATMDDLIRQFQKLQPQPQKR